MIIGLIFVISSYFIPTCLSASERNCYEVKKLYYAGFLKGYQEGELFVKALMEEGKSEQKEIMVSLLKRVDLLPDESEEISGPEIITFRMAVFLGTMTHVFIKNHHEDHELQQSLNELFLQGTVKRAVSLIVEQMIVELLEGYDKLTPYSFAQTVDACSSFIFKMALRDLHGDPRKKSDSDRQPESYVLRAVEKVGFIEILILIFTLM